MDALSEKIEAAKNDNEALERLISNYMPFIIKTVNNAGNLGIEYDDRLSFAMLTFLNCVRQYDSRKGNFITFTSACIHNRLIDESRKQQRYSGNVIPLFPDADDRNMESAEEKASVDAYNQERERESLSYEILAFSEQLGDFSISFKELPRIFPKQERSRKQCIQLGRFVAGNKEMRENLFKYNRLAQSALAKQFGLSEKTIEKHRKYIVAIVILLTGDYPLIRAFLPHYNEV